ncbi:hypothetical protein O1611_g4005 [Lasiodiplodia mahajangana]|uniref:Uncharacterized protein n=1 Tax=Lasiodiplodia mahajangana TaxID=1108764 RepID=A0ACC2JQH9_9PEZI|nr:hypothetical protein O1611_g4005 [Lasiodiplodia mahajangana]
MSSGGGASRQKSCNACVRSKRRCDKRKPACSRCVKQRWSCIYGGRAHAGATLGGSAEVPFSMDFSSDPTLNSDPFIPAPNAPPTMLGTDLGLASDLAFQFNNDFSSLFTMSGSSSFPGDPWLSRFAEESATPREKSLMRRDYSKMAPVCDDYAPWQLADASTKAAFTMSAFKRFHVNFAQTSSTLYIHRYLYKDNMPRSMLQAFSMCLLYTNQTAANRAVVLRVLHETVIDLKATANNTALVPQEKLARVHALMFYQTIRMFDGDITLGQQAEEDMALLETWNRDLCKLRDNLDDLVNQGTAISEHPPESWERWIFAESLRRTCIMCICIQKFWGLLRTQLKTADVIEWEVVCRWTLSRVSNNGSPFLALVPRTFSASKLMSSYHLWDAQNSFDFFQAWKEKPIYIISSFDFVDFLKTGTGDDLDDFTFYFLTLYFGVNAIKTFCSETSGRVMELP